MANAPNPIPPTIPQRQVTITVEPISPTSQDAKYNESNIDKFAVWTDYAIENHYIDDQGIFVMPVTSPGGFQSASVGFVQINAPTLLWVCDWTACRFNVQPDIPSKTPSDSNWVFLHATPVTRNLVIAGDGVTPLYRITGTYVYAHKNPTSDVFDKVQYPRPPWLEDVFNRTEPKDKQKKGISDIPTANRPGPTGPVR
jgi:hypothetical protein